MVDFHAEVGTSLVVVFLGPGNQSYLSTDSSGYKWTLIPL